MLKVDNYTVYIGWVACFVIDNMIVSAYDPINKKFWFSQGWSLDRISRRQRIEKLASSSLYGHVVKINSQTKGIN